MRSRKWCAYWYVFCFVLGFKLRYMYRKLMTFFREFIFQSLIRMILRQKALDQFYSWYINSNTTEVVAQKSWLSHFAMRYLTFRGWMTTLSKRQDGYLNQRVILFRLQYETHSLQMNTELPCMYVAAPTPNLSDQRYPLSLVVVPGWYFPIPSPFFQPILPSPSYHISSVAIPHLLHRHIHTRLQCQRL